MRGLLLVAGLVVGCGPDYGGAEAVFCAGDGRLAVGMSSGASFECLSASAADLEDDGSGLLVYSYLAREVPGGVVAVEDAAGPTPIIRVEHLSGEVVAFSVRR